MGKEIEIRFELLNSKELTSTLNKIAYKATETHQIDTYYDNKKNTFIKDIDHIYDWLRVREEEEIYSINYKHWLPEGAEIRTYCEEHELIISSAEKMKNLLKSIGFDILVIVDKKRTVWNYKNYEVSIDIVDNLGEYIEIEYKGSEINDISEIHESLYNVLSEISAKVGSEDHGGYGFKLIKRQVG